MDLRIASVVVLAGLLVVPAVAQAQETSLTVTAKEEDACPEDKTYCFDLSRDDVPADETINATVVNQKNHTDHSFYFDWTGDYDTSHEDSPESAGDAEVDTIPANESRSTEFTIPTSAGSTLYIWCDEPAHEKLGMWATLQITGLSGGGNGDDGDDGTDGQPPSTPGFGVVALVAAAGAAWVLSSRRH